MIFFKAFVLTLLILLLLWSQFSLGLKYFSFLAVSLSCILVFFGVSTGTIALGFTISTLAELIGGIPAGTASLSYVLLVIIFYGAKNTLNMNLNQQATGWIWRQSFVATLLSLVYIFLSWGISHLLFKNLPTLDIKFFVYNVGIFGFVYSIILLSFIKRLFGNLYKFGAL